MMNFILETRFGFDLYCFASRDVYLSSIKSMEGKTYNLYFPTSLPLPRFLSQTAISESSLSLLWDYNY
jgi:hypothetical protein